MYKDMTNSEVVLLDIWIFENYTTELAHSEVK